ncbi:MAG: hypothetical protein ACLTMP_12630 [Eggerthella lenta]
MNGIEVEAVMFGHNFNRNCEDNDLRRDLALMRRIEAGQQKHVNWLSPSDETPLETTIGYEQLAVDLTAWLAMHEPDAYAKSCMDFALLEDFDHLAATRTSPWTRIRWRMARHTIEITPSTVRHHRHPFDPARRQRQDGRYPHNPARLPTAGEQQTRTSRTGTRSSKLARDLYLRSAW